MRNTFRMMLYVEKHVSHTYVEEPSDRYLHNSVRFPFPSSWKHFTAKSLKVAL